MADGKFTLSGGVPTRCSYVSWIKLDLLSSTPYPAPWLPAPSKEWCTYPEPFNSTPMAVNPISSAPLPRTYTPRGVRVVPDRLTA